MPIIVPIKEGHGGIDSATDADFRTLNTSGSGLDVLGAGLAGVGGGSGRLAGTLDEQRRRELVAAIAAAHLDEAHGRNIDDAAAKKAYVEYSDSAAKLLRGEDGLLNRGGAEAHALFPDMVKNLADAHDGALASLTAEQSSIVVPVLTDRLWRDIALAGAHVRKEGAKEQRQQSKALQEAAARDAVAHAADPDLFDHHMATGENAIRQQATIDNVPGRVLDKQIADYKSGVHAASIDALTMHDPMQAAASYAHHVDDLNDSAKRNIEATLGSALVAVHAPSVAAPEDAAMIQPLPAAQDQAAEGIGSAGRSGGIGRGLHHASFELADIMAGQGPGEQSLASPADATDIATAPAPSVPAGKSPTKGVTPTSGASRSTERKVTTPRRGAPMLAGEETDPRTLLPSMRQPPSPASGDGASRPFRSRTITLHDDVTEIKLTGGIWRAKFGDWDVAVKHLEHYLEASGKPVLLDTGRMLREIPDFQYKRSQDFRNNIMRLVVRKISFDHFGQYGVFNVSGAWRSSDAYDPTVPFRNTRDHKNWGFAVGQFAFQNVAAVRVTKGTKGMVDVTIYPRVYVFDRYNFDNNKQAGTSDFFQMDDKSMQHLHEIGRAREFDMTGYANFRPLTFSFNPKEYRANHH
ncbi:MAG TPA: hypothetical protein VK980_12205 [Sphingomonas sp.]|nr:hypothetical protein [Sphingomonas sp.]